MSLLSPWRRRAVLACAVLGCAATAAWAADAGVRARDAWARPTVPAQSVGGAYLTLENAGPAADRLLGASTPAAQAVELHSMQMDGNVMRMRQVEAIELPAGGSVALAPGGLHLMLMGLKAPLKAGDRLPLVLRLERAGELRTELRVSPTAPGGAAAMPAGHDHGAGHKH